MLPFKTPKVPAQKEAKSDNSSNGSSDKKDDSNHNTEDKKANKEILNISSKQRPSLVPFNSNKLLSKMKK